MTLALDSTTPSGSLAVARGDTVLVARAGDASRPHAERLPGDVVALLAEAGLGLDDVTLFAVALGPGAFTGLRIGIAAIQGLAFASGRPVAGVSALDALAQAGSDVARPAPGTPVGVFMDAARQEVFASLYEVIETRPGGLARLAVLDPPSVGPAASILERWTPLVAGRAGVLVGEGALRYREAVERAGAGLVVRDEWPPVAAAMVPLALEAARHGRAGAPGALRPLYVRRPDAEIAREQRAGTNAGVR